MIKAVSHVNVWVHDQDEAKAFYTESWVLRSAKTRRWRRWRNTGGSP